MDDFVLAVRTLLGGAWSALTTLKYPMVDIPFVQILVGGFLVVFTLRILGNVFGWSVSSSSSSAGGNNKKIKVSDERKNDNK